MRSPIMVGERVYLRPFEKGDAEAMAEMDAAETDTFMWRNRDPTSPLGYESWIADMYTKQPPGAIDFAVCTREQDRLLGMVAIVGIDWVHRTGETASFLGPAEVRGQEYGTEAKHLLLEYCFDRIHLHVLKSQVNGPNTRSQAALGKQGYRVAGRQRWGDVKDGRYVDAILFDLMRSEWLVAREAWRARRLERAST